MIGILYCYVCLLPLSLPSKAGHGYVFLLMMSPFIFACGISILVVVFAIAFPLIQCVFPLVVLAMFGNSIKILVFACMDAGAGIIVLSIIMILVIALSICGLC